MTRVRPTPAAARALWAGGLLATLAGCSEPNRYFCQNDADCQQAIGQKLVAAGAVRCHPLAHLCYPGCRTDADCQGLDGLRSGLVCALPEGHCLAPEADGGVPDVRPPDGGADGGHDSKADRDRFDLGEDQLVPDMLFGLGTGCTQGSACASGRCTDGVCCESSDCGPCQRCDLSGDGRCAMVDDGQDPDMDCGTDSTCKGVCDGSGACRYPNAGHDCQVSCDTSNTVFEQIHVCTAAGTCDTTSVDRTVRCGACMRCATVGATAGCTAVADGPHTDCGTGSCAGLCKGGACDFSAVPSSKRCAADCNGARIDQRFCDGNGACSTAVSPSFIDCTPYLCNNQSGSNDACHTGCAADHAECVASSACDRTNVHVDGVGRCAPTAEVVSVANDAALGTALGQSWTGRRLFRLAPGLYTKTTIAGHHVMLVGSGDVSDVTFKPSGTSEPCIDVQDSAGSRLTVQGLTLTGATGGDGHGIRCLGTSANHPQVTVVESLIEGNAGVGIRSSDCDVTVRRSTLSRNGGGGLRLTDGEFRVTNTLLVENGTAGSGVGGALLTGATATSTFEHNTVFLNNAAGTYSGVECSAGLATLANSIVSGNLKSQTNCTLSNTNTNALATGSGSCELTTSSQNGVTIPLPTAAVCLDTNGTTALPVDHDGHPRTQGTGPDLGAYEQP